MKKKIGLVSLSIILLISLFVDGSPVYSSRFGSELINNPNEINMVLKEESSKALDTVNGRLVGEEIQIIVNRKRVNFAVLSEEVDQTGTVAVVDNTLNSYKGTVLDFTKPLVKDGVTYTVTEIAEKAFDGVDVAGIVLPSTVKKIGARAFADTTIETMNIPEGVEHVGSEAFAGCNFLNGIKFPESLKNIGHALFGQFYPDKNFPWDHLRGITFLADVRKVNIIDDGYGSGQVPFIGVPTSTPIVAKNKDDYVVLRGSTKLTGNIQSSQEMTTYEIDMKFYDNKHQELVSCTPVKKLWGFNVAFYKTDEGFWTYTDDSNCPFLPSFPSDLGYDAKYWGLGEYGVYSIDPTRGMEGEENTILSSSMVNNSSGSNIWALNQESKKVFTNKFYAVEEAFTIRPTVTYDSTHTMANILLSINRNISSNTDEVFNISLVLSNGKEKKKLDVFKEGGNVYRIDFPNIAHEGEYGIELEYGVDNDLDVNTITWKTNHGKDYSTIHKDLKYLIELNQKELQVNPITETTIEWNKQDALPVISLTDGDSQGEITWNIGQKPLKGKYSYIYTFTPSQIEDTNSVDDTIKKFIYKEITDLNYIKSGAIDINYYEKVLEHHVVFKDWDGSIIKEEDVISGESAIAPTSPVRKGHTFSCWDKDYNQVTGDLTITAIYTVNKYKVQFIGKDGVSIKDEDLEYGGLIVTPKSPNIDGYNFISWDPLVDEKVPAHDVVYIAVYEAIEYKGVFDSNGGKEDIQIIAQKYEQPLGELPTVTKEGYKFDGWYTEKNGGILIDTNTPMPLNGTTYYAHWKLCQYEIVFKLNNGENDKIILTNYGDKVDKPINPEKAHYQFDSWNKEESCINKWDFENDVIKGKQTLYAKYTPKIYNISYDLNNGNLPDGNQNILEYTIESPAFKLINPKREGYSFIGWTGSNGQVAQEEVLITAGSAGPLIYFANWTVNQYTANFDGNGGSDGKAIIKDYGTALGELPQSSREGYTLNGWFTKADGGTQITSETLMPFNGATYFAHWTINTNTVSFDSHGGSIVNTKVTGEYGSPLGTLPETSRDGYEFMGWFTEKTGGTKISSTSKIPAVDTTYFAQWVIEEYSISYDLNDDNTGLAKNDPANKEKYTVEESLTLKAPSYPKHVFIGWTYEDKTIPEMNVEIKQGSMGNKSYKANWVDSDYTVSFDSQGGSKIEDKGASYQGLVSIPSDPIKPGCEFKGWYKEKECKNAWNFASNKVSSNLTLYAKWEVNQYTASFNANGGESVTPSSIKKNYGEALGTLPTCSKVGHLFKGWFTEVTGGSEIDEYTTVIDRDITYYAQWQVIKYTASFDGNGGSNGIDIIVDYQTVLGKLPESSREGYKFEGWFTSKTGGTKVTEGTVMPFNGATYFAHWTANKYTVSFDGNGGSDGKAIVKDYGTTLGELPGSTREGYEFIGWYDAKSGGNKIEATTLMSGDMTYFAKWKILQFTVSFDANGGNQVNDIIKKDYNSELGTLPETSRNGYQFKGWFTTKDSDIEIKDTSKIPAQNTTYFAQWVIEEYTISYHLNDDNTGLAKNDPVNKEKYTVEESLTLKAPSYPKHVFIGWTYEDKTIPEMNVMIEKGTTGNKSYKANWVDSDYTVSFDSQGGSKIEDKGASYQGLVSIPSDPIKPGYEFKGWYKEKECKNAWNFEKDKVTTHLTLFAKWEVKQYTASFNANGGESVTASSITKNYNEALGQLPTCKKVGHSFIGWFTEVIGGDKITEQTTMPASDITYYAQWEVIKYTASFDGNGGSDGKAIIKDYGTTLGELPGSTREGYEFIGWYDAKSGGNKIEVTTLMSGDMTYFAHWTINSYTALFDVNGGSDLSFTHITKNYNETLDQLPTCSKVGYAFEGWYDASSGGNKITAKTTMPAKDMTYYAHWTILQFTVSFDANGGSKVNETIKKDYESELGILPETSRKGYDFVGWFTTKDSDEQVTSTSKIPAEDITYYARWNVHEYAIGYDLNDEGSNKAVNPKSNKTKYTIEEETFNLKGATWDKHAFIGWTDEENTIPEKVVTIEKGTIGDKNYKANWVVSDFTVNFDAQGGSEILSQGAQLNNVIFEPDQPTFNGYQFEGWYKEKECLNKWNFEKDKVISNLTLYAKWSLEEYSIEYDLDGGTGDLTNPSKYTIKDSFTLKKPIKEGYEFMGWTYGSIQEPSKSIFVKEGTTGDFVFVAHWQLETYSIEYDLKGGEAINKIEYTYETESFTLNNPTQLGYMFTGWTWDQQEAPVLEVTLPKHSMGNKKYIAHYELVSYRIIYNLEGGHANNPETYNVHTDTFELVAPIKEGYEFIGWTYKDHEIPEKVVSIETMSTGNREYKANWKKLSYPVLFESNGGSLVERQEIEYGNTLIQPKAPVLEGYQFVGWFIDPMFEVEWNFKDKVISKMTLYAKWDVQQYTASFNGNGGSDGEDIVLDYQSSLGKLPISTREGYEFIGWYDTKIGGTKITEDTKMPINGVTYYAHWDCVVYTMTYDLKNGINNTQNPNTYTIEDEFTLKVPSLTGHVFMGWTWKNQNTPTKEVIIQKGTTGNKTYIANWKISDSTVTFDSQGGSQVNSLGVQYQTPVSIPGDPIKEGYSFEGWFKDSQGINKWNFDEPVTRDITLYAKWKINQYRAKFDGNGGNNGEDIVLDYQSSLGKLPISNREGYSFIGWYDALIDGQKIDENTKMPPGGITYYARWEANRYQVHFDTLGGSVIDSQLVEYGQTLKQPTAPIKEGYVFDKWYQDTTLSKEWVVNENKVLSDMHLYAGYKMIPTLISNIQSGEVKKGTKLILSTLPKDGNIYYTIDGTIPTKESTPYHLPIEINQTTSIKVITIYDQVESPVYTFNYTVTGDILVSLDSDSSIVSGTKEEDLIDAILDEQDLKRYQQGEHIDIEIKCQPISLVPTSEIMSQLEGKNLANAYDITVFKQFMNEEKIQLNELNKPIQLVLDIPLQHLPKEEIDRVFTVMRIHGDKIEFLTDLDTNDKTVTIETQLFSNYVLCYEDKAKKEPILPTQDPLPETGDKLSFAEWSVVSFVSFVVLVFVVVYKWNKKKKD